VPNTIDVTQAQYFIPEIWANEALAILRQHVVATPRVARDSDVGAFQRGDILHIPDPGTLAASDKAAGTEYTLAQPSNETEVQVTLNKHKAVSVVVEDIVRAQASQDIVRRYSEAAAIAIAEQVETDLITEMLTATNTDGVTSYGTDLSAAGLRAAWKKMTDLKCPQDGRFLLASTQDAISLMGDSELTSYLAFSRPQAVAGGPDFLGNLYGFETYSSQFIALTGASVTTVTGEADTEVITKTAHGLAVNDTIEFSSITGGTGLSTGTQYFVVSVPSADTFTISATKGGSAVNFTADITEAIFAKINRKNLAWRRDGVMAAFRGLPEPPAGSGAVAANVMDPQSGVVMRVLMAYDARLGGVQITHEVLYGVKLLQAAKVIYLKA
jgi:hypothetical protein